MNCFRGFIAAMTITDDSERPGAAATAAFGPGGWAQNRSAGIARTGLAEAGWVEVTAVRRRNVRTDAGAGHAVEEGDVVVLLVLGSRGLRPRSGCLQGE